LQIPKKSRPVAVYCHPSTSHAVAHQSFMSGDAAPWHPDFRDNDLLFREYSRAYENTLTRESRCLKVDAREWKGIPGGSEFALAARFESDPDEKIFGMGQYQQLPMNLKGCLLELAQRNSQISVPFALSSRGYGFLWNNPAVGRVMFGTNYTEWHAASTRMLDYWVTAGETPRDILRSYTAVTGRAGEFPEDLLGLWQCKLRYRTQQEVLDVAREYRRRGLPLDQIIIDFFHWTLQGDWKFDACYWPDPAAMVEELHEMGIRVIVSVWPSVDRRSENYEEFADRGLLMRTDRGAPQTYDYQGDCVEIDPFNPETRRRIWEICRRNYYDYGIDGFWLDNIEPDLVAYDFDHYRYSAGPALAISNIYPQLVSRAFCEGLEAAGDRNAVNLVRCCWAGSQRFRNVVWSGDIPSTFEAFADQVQCGLNMGLAGIPWWTTDIGGFMTPDSSDPGFQQLMVRWFQFAVYSPVLRMHGNRGPHNIPPLDSRDHGGGYLFTGQPNELWSFGEENLHILRACLEERESLRGYISSLYKEASENGSPLMRTMFYEFPGDPVCWNLQDQYMFGPKYLAAPVLHLNEYSRTVYLPEGRWRLIRTREEFTGCRTVEAEAPLSSMPVFERL
ncbi:MAG: glycoside hydrolase family 31 protein, partial [Clostridia bacterium]|nr:glycoside hydrolase family 31 protein [Clostridia bacterium]